jgi:toxin ParE1/3/4
MRVRYTPEAFADRERIIKYLKERSESGAQNVAASIHQAVAQLGNQPHSGYRTDNPEVRVLFVVRYPYKIFYRVRDDTVEILHIRHTSRRAWTGPLQSSER